MKRVHVQAVYLADQAVLDATGTLYGVTWSTDFMRWCPATISARSLRALRRKTRKAEATGQWRAVGEPELIEFPARSDARFWRVPAED